jgi:hypothetical protein
MGGKGSGSNIFWKTYPAATGVTITGNGTYTRPAGTTTVAVQMMLLDSAGGPFQVQAATTDETVTPWTWTSPAFTVTAGRAYNVFAVETINAGPDGSVQYAAPVIPVAVPQSGTLP